MQKVAVKARHLTEIEKEEIGAFVNKLRELLEGEKYVELARHHLDYQQPIPDNAWKEIIPGVTAKLEKEAKHGGLELIRALLSDRSNWFTSDSGVALLYHPGNPFYHYLVCSKGGDGKWLLRSISSGIPMEMAGSVQPPVGTENTPARSKKDNAK